MPKPTFDTWRDTFRPQTNPFNADAPVDGYMLETFGEEFELVQKTLRESPDRVWTVVEGDDDNWYISQGFHLVNRIGYLVTEVAFNHDDPDMVKTYLSQDVLFD